MTINKILREIYIKIGGNVQDIEYADNVTILNEIAKIKGGNGNNSSSFEALKEINNLL